jgi:hypothetical protein
MTIPAVGAFAIVPSNDLQAAVPVWERLGFARTGCEEQYIIMTDWDCEVHLIQAGEGLWRVPEQNNPFDIFIRGDLRLSRTFLPEISLPPSTNRRVSSPR